MRRLTFALCLLLCVLLPCLAAAQTPAPTSFSGTFSNGQSITITGTNFGATGPTVILFDNFEGGSNGTQVNMSGATVGSWRTTAPPANRPVYSTGQALSGTLSAMADTSGPNNDNGMPVAIDAKDVYLSASIKLPTGDVVPGNGNASDPNWKIFWVYEIDTETNGNNITPAWAGTGPLPINNWKMFGNGQPMESDNSSYFVSCASHYAPCVSADWDFNSGSWYRFQEYHFGDPADGSAENQFSWSNKDRPTNWASYYNSTHANVEVGFTTFHEWVVHGFNRQTVTGTSRFYYDDVYVATSATKGCARARVEIGNASTYATSSNLSLVTTTAWGDTSITGVVRAGSFGSSASAYLYVTQCNGNRNSSGMAVTFGSSGGAGGGTSGPRTKPRLRFRVQWIPVTALPIFAGVFLISRRRR